MQVKTELDRAEVLDWRNKERCDLVLIIKERLDSFYPEINTLVDNMSVWDLVKRANFHDRKIAPIVEAWLKSLFDDLHRDIKVSSKTSELSLGSDPELDRYLWSWQEVVGTGLATTVTLAPLAAVPLGATLATTTTTTFFVFTTSAVSIPILSIVITGILVVGGVSGHKFRKYIRDWVTNNYREQVKKVILTKVLGDPVNQKISSLRTIFLHEIDSVAKKRLELHQ